MKTKKINYTTIEQTVNGKAVKFKLPLRALFFETDRNKVQDDIVVDVGLQKMRLASKDRELICEQLLTDDTDRMDFVKWSKKKTGKKVLV
jgi:hypothetical protein